MSEHIVDARGLACPQPVILTKRGLNDPSLEVITVIVDNEAACKNVIMLAEKEGAMYTSESRDDGYYITLSRPQSRGAVGGGASEPAGSPAVEGANAESPQPGQDGIARTASVLVIDSSVMGRGDDELGGILIRGFFHALVESESKPETVIFFNTGVALTAEDSPVLEDLLELEKYGINILVCGTCLEYFGIGESHRAGTISNMYTITETLLEAGRVITL